MRSFFIMLIGLFVCYFSFSQEPVKVERSRNKVIIEDKVYYIHVVKPGQTLYSISKAYNVSQKAIAIENPGAVSGLQIGQALKIPVDGEPEKVDTTEYPLSKNETFKRHIIREGETLYSISKNYNVNIDSILQYNRDIEITDLRIGDEIKIPLYPDEKETEQPSFNEEGFIYHKVKRKETLYSISRYYEVTVEDIRSTNPVLGWGGPKNGQVIRIPKPQITNDAFIALDTIVPDSAYVIFPDTVIDEYKYGELYFEDYRPRKVYKAAFLIPFNLIESEPLDTLLKDVKSQNQRNRIIERYHLDQAVPQSVNFLEFFEGALLALDSVRKSGMKLEVRFYDTKRSTTRINEILNLNDLENMDLIIGPFYSFNLAPVSDFCKEFNIPLVTPFHSDYNNVSFNPYLFQTNTSYQTEYQHAVKYIARNFDKNIVLVHNGDSLEMDMINYFKNLLFKEFREYVDVGDVIMKEVVLDKSSAAELIHSLTKDKDNLVIVPLDDEALASRIVSSLYFQLKDFNIELYGTSSWPEFTSIDVRYFHDLNLTFSHPGMVNYDDTLTINFLADYRENYYAEPVEKTRNGSLFAFMGYDITLYFLNAIRLYGPRFILKLDDYYPELLLSDYKFNRVTPFGGYENVNLKYYRFTPDMNIGIIQMPAKPGNFELEPFEDHRVPSYLYLDRELPDKEH